jgi:hypothetical protein
MRSLDINRRTTAMPEIHMHTTPNLIIKGPLLSLGLGRGVSIVLSLLFNENGRKADSVCTTMLEWSTEEGGTEI